MVMTTWIRRLGSSSLLALTLNMPLLTQDPSPSPHDLPPLLPVAEEAALAQSAAPVEISSRAAILILKRGGYETLREGTNGFVCLVDRIYADSVEPICFNPEASRSILQVQLRRAELREQGWSHADIEKEIEAELQSGQLGHPEGLAIGYML